MGTARASVNSSTISMHDGGHTSASARQPRQQRDRQNLHQQAEKRAKYNVKCDVHGLCFTTNERTTQRPPTDQSSWQCCDQSRSGVALVPSFRWAIMTFAPRRFCKRSRVRWRRRDLLSRKCWMRAACRLGRLFAVMACEA